MGYSTYERSTPYSRKGGNKYGNNSGNSYGNRQYNDVDHAYSSAPCFKNLPPFVKDFYIEHAEVSAMTSEQVRAFREEHQMVLQGSNIPKPMVSFSHANWPPAISQIFMKSGFEKPTPIQGQGWPMALSGRNVIGIAQTGSGKTLSFVLPAFVHIQAQPKVERGDGPVCLVLAPTRELAVQIHQVIAQYGTPIGIRHACLYGGAPKGGQIRELNQSPHVIVATPGRLLDLLKMGKTSLRRVTYLVLDEADRMLDMGFEEALREISGQIRPDRQMLFWSATWPKSVQRLARDFQGADAIQVRIGNQSLHANKAITQHVTVVKSSYDKTAELDKVLEMIWNSIPGDDSQKKMERTIIFVNQKHMCERIMEDLSSKQWYSCTIHGDKDQRERDYALRNFKSGDCPILIATDVAARGLDVKELKHVINFDFPKNVEDFVHRIGRTGRGGETGFSYTFFDQREDGKNARDLVNLMKEAQQNVPVELENLCYGGRNYGNNSKGNYGNNGRGKYGGFKRGSRY